MQQRAKNIYMHARVQEICVHAHMYNRMKITPKVDAMPSTLRLTDWEQEELRKKCTEINKLLIKEGKSPLKDSELAHEILKISIKQVKLDRNLNIYIEE